MKTIVRHYRLAALGVVLGLVPAVGFAQRPINEHHIAPAANTQDKGDISTMIFDFKSPRMVELNIPGVGKRVVWYMCYWLSNYNKEPFTVYPEFLLMTNRHTLHRDEVVPEVEEAIRKIEDPTNRFHFENSVSISKNPIPVSKPDALPRRVAGIAIWTDVKEKAPETSEFKIFVTGLSNGWHIDDAGQISRKTLMLQFERRGDGTRVDSNEIVYNDGFKWIYRDASAADVDLKPPASAVPEKPPQVVGEPAK